MIRVFSVFLLLVAGASADEVRNVVATISPRLVRIDTIGGHEKVGDEFANEGAGSGLLLDAEGHVITAAFLFLHDPTSVLLRLGDGTKKVAKKICTDRNRMLTLLKITDVSPALLEKSLDVRTKDSIRPGERCIAVGVALSQAEPNLARGIVSGKDRIWGKALQTDAAVGPNNYGGPLLDAEGKLLGILVPLSMMSSEITAGAEMYDAGVGMAVPLEDIMTILPEMKKGVDLLPGRLGIEFRENRIFIGEPIIDAIQPESPAAAADLKKGDRITALDGKPIETALQATMSFRSLYAGDTVKLRIRRGKKDHEMTLTAAEPEKRNTLQRKEEK